MARKAKRKTSKAVARRFVPDDEQRNAICAMLSVGVQRRIIAHMLHIPLTTLERYFPYELEFGRDLVHAKVGTGLAALALSGNLTAMIYYSKAQMGWRDRDPANLQASAQTADTLFTVSITG